MPFASGSGGPRKLRRDRPVPSESMATFTTLFEPFIRPGDRLLLTDGSGKKGLYVVTSVEHGHDFVTMLIVRPRGNLGWVLLACGVAFALGLAAALL